MMLSNVLAASLLLSLVSFSEASPQLHRQQRGLFDDMWGDLRDGFDQFSQSASHDLARIGQEVKPAVRQMETTLNHALSQVMRRSNHLLRNNPFFTRFGSADERVDQSAPVLSQSSHEGDSAIDVPEEGETGVELPFGDLSGLLGEPLDPFRIFGISRRKWWDGPNVCVDRKVLDEGSSAREEGQDSAGPIFMMDMTMTSCRDGPTFHECTTKTNTNGRKKTVVVKHECCYGYTRTEGELGCSEMVLKSLDETVVDVGGDEFLQLLDAVNMRSILKNNLTVFVPSDEAIEDFRREMEQMNAIELSSGGGYNVDDGLKIEVNRRRKRQELTIVESPSLESILEGHMLGGFVTTSDLHDEDVLDTLEGSDSKIRVTMYNRRSGPIMMANCAQVTSSDHLSSNGVVHSVDKVLMPARQTLAEIISTDSQFTQLAKALEEAGMMEELAEPSGQMTFFAPTDAAFDSLDEETKEKIMSGTGCSADILKNHLLHNVICSGVVEGKAKTANALKKYLIVDRDEEDVVTVDGVRLKMTDIIGVNGILHVVEDVLIPASSRTVDEALDEEGSSTLAELFKMADLDLDTLSNTTVFAPSEAALSQLPASFMDNLKADKTKLREFLLYHVAQPKTCKCDFEDGREYPTMREGKKPLRMNVYNSISAANILGIPKQTVTVQCARLSHLDEEACGSMIHTVDRVLLPPGGNVISILKDVGKFSKFLELIAFAELENKLSTEGPYTVMAPTDSAFERLDEETLEKIFSETDAAVSTVYKHVINDHLCCAGIPRQMPFLDLSGRRTMGGDVISLHKTRGGHLFADRAEMTTCDMLAENGVVHQLDRVLLPESLVPKNADKAQEKNDSSPWIILKLFEKK